MVRKENTMVDIRRIEKLRAEHGYSQEQLAKFLGYESHTAYSRKVNGKRDFSIEDIITICRLYQITPNELIIIEG